MRTTKRATPAFLFVTARVPLHGRVCGRLKDVDRVSCDSDRMSCQSAGSDAKEPSRPCRVKGVEGQGKPFRPTAFTSVAAVGCTACCGRQHPCACRSFYA